MKYFYCPDTFLGGIWIYFFHCCTSGVEVNTIKTPEMYRRRSCDSFSSGQEMSVLLHATAAHVATQQLSGVTYMVDAWWNSLRRAVCRRRPPPSSCYKQVSHEEEGGHQGKMYREQQAWIHTGGIKALWRRPKQGYFNNVFHLFFSVLRSFFFVATKKFVANYVYLILKNSTFILGSLTFGSVWCSAVQIKHMRLWAPSHPNRTPTGQQFSLNYFWHKLYQQATLTLPRRTWGTLISLFSKVTAQCHLMVENGYSLKIQAHKGDCRSFGLLRKSNFKLLTTLFCCTHQ